MAELTMIGVKVTPEMRARIDAVVAEMKATEPEATTSSLVRRAIVAFVLKAERKRGAR